MEILSTVWNWDPTFITIGGMDIRWYGLMWAVAILVAERLCNYMFSREGLPPRTLESAFIWIVLGTFIGARVGHCLFYEPATYLAEPWRIITDIRNGGMASHGATIGIIFGVWMFTKRNHLPFLWGFDRIGVVAPLSGALIRIGNLFNSEIVGKVTGSDFGFKFVYHDARETWRATGGDVPAEVIEQIPARYPAQLYEAICYFLIFIALMWLYRRKDLGRRRPGVLIGASLICIFVSRFFIEFIKERQVDFESGMVLDMGQWLSIPFIIIGIFLVVRAYLRPEETDLNAVVAHANREYAKEDKKKGKKK